MNSPDCLAPGKALNNFHSSLHHNGLNHLEDKMINQQKSLALHIILVCSTHTTKKQGRKYREEAMRQLESHRLYQQQEALGQQETEGWEGDLRTIRKRADPPCAAFLRAKTQKSMATLSSKTTLLSSFIAYCSPGSLAIPGYACSGFVPYI